MIGLSFNHLPHYIYSNHRQFHAHEHHIDRIFVSSRSSLSTIAYDVGFGDYTVFYRAFVEKYGISPKDYRANYRLSR